MRKLLFSLLFLVSVSFASVPFVATGAGASSATGPRLGYWGGHVLRNVKVVAVVWGSGQYTAQVTGTAAPNVATFFAGVTASRYFDWLREYDATALGEHIGRGRFVARITIRPSTRNNGARIDDLANIRPELLAQVRAGHLPAPDANTLYFLFLRRGQVVTSGGLDSVTGFCAYHGTVRLRAGVAVRYAVVPATAAGVHCGRAPGFGNLTTAASHELIEAVTDPDVGLATRLGPPLAWYDPGHGEIGDLCAGRATLLTGGDGRRYTVQLEWSNRRRACVAT